MKKEHIVHFKIIRGGETSRLTGLIYLEDGAQPTLGDFADCLKQCGHDVRIEDEKHFIFRSNNPAEDYLIDVLEDYKPNNKDLSSDNLARSFIKPTTFL